MVNWTPGNKLQWNSNRNSIIFIQENASEIVVCQDVGHFVQGEMSYNTALCVFVIDIISFVYIKLQYFPLPHWGRVTHICVSKTDNYWFWWKLVTWLAASHHLNQCWLIVNWTLKNKFQWNLNKNSSIFVRKNAFENIVCEMVAILARPQYVNLKLHMTLSNPTVIRYRKWITVVGHWTTFQSQVALVVRWLLN